MGIAEYIIIIIIGIKILKNIMLFIYCFFAEKMDKRFFEKIELNKNINDGLIENQTKEESTEKKGIVSKLYSIVNSYAYGFMRYNLILVGKIPSTRIRHFFYKFIYRMKISKKTVIYGGCEIRSPWNITIGNSVVAVGCLLDGRQKITIGDNVVFGSFVHLWTEEHDLNDPYFRVTPKHSQPIVIEDYAWICSDSTILPGIHVHKGAVVAARACVTKDCDEYCVYAGIPAKKISDRSKNLKYKLGGKPTWHFY